MTQTLNDIEEMDSVSILSMTKLVTFMLGDSRYGIDILAVQEINKQRDWTPVPRSKDYILGIMSLRGNIVKVIDLGRRIDSRCTDMSGPCRNIVVKTKNKCVGLLVDKIGDVVVVKEDQLVNSPANVDRCSGAYIKGVLKTDDDIISILNIDVLVNDSAVGEGE